MLEYHRRWRMDTNDKTACEYKHERIEEILNDYGIRITDLEDKDESHAIVLARLEVMVTSLCEQIKSLVTIIKGGAGFIIVTLVGFFIWYIQSL